MKNPTAFPVYPRHSGSDSQQIKDAVGMTLRDYFAAKTMQAILSCDVTVKVMADADRNAAYIAEVAYDQADAMLKAREE